jgi:hypothetical protein
MTDAERQARYRARLIAAQRYVIACTPGGLLRNDDDSLLIFESRAEAEEEALRLTKADHANAYVAGMDFTATMMPPEAVEEIDRLQQHLIEAEAAVAALRRPARPAAAPRVTRAPRPAP